MDPGSDYGTARSGNRCSHQVVSVMLLQTDRAPRSSPLPAYAVGPDQRCCKQRIEIVHSSTAHRHGNNEEDLPLKARQYLEIAEPAHALGKPFRPSSARRPRRSPRAAGQGASARSSQRTLPCRHRGAWPRGRLLCCPRGTPARHKRGCRLCLRSAGSRGPRGSVP